MMKAQARFRVLQYESTGKDAAGARLGIAVIAEEDFGVGCDIFEATLSRINAKISVTLLKL